MFLHDRQGFVWGGLRSMSRNAESVLYSSFGSWLRNPPPVVAARLLLWLPPTWWCTQPLLWRVSYILGISCWGQGRQCGISNNICDEEELACKKEQDTQREREREREREYLRRPSDLTLSSTTIPTSWRHCCRSPGCSLAPNFCFTYRYSWWKNLICSMDDIFCL